MDTQTTTEITPFDRFFLDLIRWRTWIAGMRESALRMIEIAKTKPTNARQDSNLYRDNLGRVWRMAHHPRYALVELRRTSEPFGAYEDTDNRVPFERYPGEAGIAKLLGVESVERSHSSPEADWPWEVKEVGRGDISTLAYFESSLARDERGIALADKLLAQRPAIEVWMKAMGLALDRRDRRATDLDWVTLFSKFAPELSSDVPDCGSIVCHLHAAIDTLGGCHGVREYYH
jgi:hypothetical protein